MTLQNHELYEVFWECFLLYKQKYKAKPTNMQALTFRTEYYNYRLSIAGNKFKKKE